MEYRRAGRFAGFDVFTRHDSGHLLFDVLPVIQNGSHIWNECAHNGIGEPLKYRPEELEVGSIMGYVDEALHGLWEGRLEIRSRGTHWRQCEC